MSNRIEDFKTALREVKVGDTITISARDYPHSAGDKSFRGYVGEKDTNTFYVWSDSELLKGSRGMVNPGTKGFRYSWVVSSSTFSWLTIEGRSSTRTSSSALKVGDEVTLIKGKYEESDSNPMGVKGTVGKIRDDYPHTLDVEWSNGKQNCYKESDLSVVNKKNMLQKLSIMMKKLLDADTQILVKAGFINGDLELTAEGEKNLWSIVFMANKTDMVKLAQAVVDEEEAKKE